MFGAPYGLQMNAGAMTGEEGARLGIVMTLLFQTVNHDFTPVQPVFTAEPADIMRAAHRDQRDLN